MEEVLKNLEEAIADYKLNAEKFYSKNNSEAGKRARKALKTVKDIAHKEWKHIQDIKKS